MGSSRRLQKELSELMCTGPPWFKNIQTEEDNIRTWTGLLLPDIKPFNGVAFRVELSFPEEYPFKPPQVTFVTPIYHPNIDENGKVCLGIITSENWKPATKVEQVEWKQFIDYLIFK